MAHICDKFCKGGVNTNKGLRAKVFDIEVIVDSVLISILTKPLTLSKKNDVNFKCPIGCIVCLSGQKDQDARNNFIENSGNPTLICTKQF